MTNTTQRVRIADAMAQALQALREADERQQRLTAELLRETRELNEASNSAPQSSNGFTEDVCDFAARIMRQCGERDHAEFWRLIREAQRRVD